MIRTLAFALVLANGAALANSSLGQVNIKLYGTIVDFTCVADTGDSDKTVALGSWPTKQLKTTGSRTQPMPFTLKLKGCPPGAHQ